MNLSKMVCLIFVSSFSLSTLAQEIIRENKKEYMQERKSTAKENMENIKGALKKNRYDNFSTRQTIHNEKVNTFDSLKDKKQ